MKFLPITDFCDFQGGTQPPKSEWSDKPMDGYIRMLQIRDFTQSERTSPEFVRNSKNLKTCSSDDVLIGRYGASIGKILTGYSGAYNVAIVKTIPNEKVLNKKFLLCLLKSPSFQNFITTIGARAAQAGFNKSDLTQFSVPILPIDDQIRIAHLLGKVEGLIVQRKQHLQQLDDLVKSVFLGMFGDPVQNDKGWDKPELRAFGKISTGNTPPRNEPANYDDDFIEWIKTDNITGNSVFVTPSSEHLSEIGARKARTVTKGALLVACIAGSVESIGRSALVDRTVSFNQQINSIQPGQDVNPLYLYGLFKLTRTYIQSHATKGMKKILTKGDFEKITMIKPPLDVQNQFAAIIEKVESIKSRYQQSLIDLEALYGSLSQQAFKGELDLSRIPIDKQTHKDKSNGKKTIRINGVPILPQHVQATLTNLNTFNQTAASHFKALEEANRLSKLPWDQLNSVSRLAEQFASFRSPLQELGQMSALSKTFEQAQAAIKKANLDRIGSLTQSAELARSLALEVPKIDFDRLSLHDELVKKANEPFESLRKSIEQLRIPSQNYFDSISSQIETAKRFQSTIPDFTTWQKNYSEVSEFDFDDSDKLFARYFEAEDVVGVISSANEPLSFESLLQQLGEFSAVDFAGYERIKAIIFDLLANNQLKQVFDENQKTLFFSAVVTVNSQ